MNNMKYLKSFIFIILMSFIGSITAMRVSAHKITHIQPVDMFPHSHHVENIVCLVRK